MKNNDYRKQTESFNVSEQNPTEAVNVNEHFLQKKLQEGGIVNY